MSKPDAAAADNEHSIEYTDLSNAVRIDLKLDKKSRTAPETSPLGVRRDARRRRRLQGGYRRYRYGGLSQPPRAVRRMSRTRVREAAENTLNGTRRPITKNPLPVRREDLLLRTSSGDMYELSITYPAKGDFTARGKEVVKVAIANLGIDKL